MSAIVSGVLKLTLGFLLNKTRSGIAERLKDGDVTDEECRRLFVRELDDIKGKLDALSRKDLRSSLVFLQEGINRLYGSFSQFDSKKDTAAESERVTSVEATSWTDTGPDWVLDKAVAFTNAMASLKIRSDDRFKSAIKSFELAREKATEAFCNEALSIEDRIQATQIRVMARILENLDDPNASVSDCLMYLKQLHDMGAIQEIFSVFVDGGIKSRFNKTQRLDNASSVHLINQILFEFARKFTKLTPMHLNWPMVLIGKKNYHPVFGESRRIGKLEKFRGQNMSLDPDIAFDDEIVPHRSVVNRKGEIVALTKEEGTYKVFKRSGEGCTLYKVPGEEQWSKWYVTAVDIDAKDNIYLIAAIQNSDGSHLILKFFILDKNGMKKLEAPLPYVTRMCMAINKDGKIAFLDCRLETLFIGAVCLEQNSFQVDDKSIHLHPLNTDSPSISYIKLMFADLNETKIIVAERHRLFIYTENGQLQHKIDGHGLNNSVTVNHVMERILVKTHGSSGNSLLSFSETGELIDSFYLGSSEWIEGAELTSHPNGPVALVGKSEAVFLQL